MSDSLRPHGLQHARLPCLSLSPRACSNSCPLSCWCHTTISSCHPLLLLTSIFPSIRVLSQPFTSGGQRIGASAQHQFFQWIFRTDFLQDWLVGSPCSPRDSQESSPTPQFKSINSPVLSLLYGPTLTPIHDYWKNHSFDYKTFVGKIMSLLFNMLSRFVIVFLPRRNCLLILWLKSLSAVILEPKKTKSVTVSIVSASIWYEWWDQMPWS